MLTSAGFLRPVGRLDADQLGGSVAAGVTLTALITAAEALTADEAVQECFVYWRAYQQVADDFAAAPTTQRDRNKSSSWSTDQLGRWQGIAREYEACFKRGMNSASGYQPGTTISKEVIPTW